MLAFLRQVMKRLVVTILDTIDTKGAEFRNIFAGKVGAINRIKPRYA